MDMGGVGTAAPGSVTVQSPGACDLRVRERTGPRAALLGEWTAPGTDRGGLFI